MIHALEKRCERLQTCPLFPNLLSEEKLINSLENTETLEGHSGCVNTLRWNRTGTLLASGSDDRLIKLWRAGKEHHSIETGHVGNVFAVEFLPCSSDRQIASGAADHHVFLHDIESKTNRNWQLEGRIKRMCTVQHDPTLFWAAVESDKSVLQFDTRTEEPDVIVQRGPLNPNNRDAKSVAVSEEKPNLIVVGFDETPVRLYDRRKLDEPILTFLPLGANSHSFHATHVAFNSSGSEVVVNHGSGGGVFVFSVDESKDPKIMERFHRVLEQPKEPVITSHSLPHRELRETGSTAIREKHFGQAIDYYSNLISLNDSDRAFRSVCHSNRATALLLRRKRGDTYACIRDCVKALEIHRGNSKALFRLVKSFTTMEHVALAKKCIEKFKEWFPNDNSIAKMEEEVNLLESNERPEMATSEGCVDYQQRFVGSTNYQTDIKEANFFGSKDQYIIAGSDCGHMYIWNRETTKLTGIWHADDHILNIVQPHPERFMIATSGIDDDIRLWQPLQEKDLDYVSRRIDDPYDFMENMQDVGGGNRMHLHLIRDFVRESPQCVQS